MVEILPAPSHVCAARLSGTVTLDDYKRLVADIETALAQHDRIAICADITNLSDMTPDAVEARVQYGLSKLGEFSRFARVAAVSDKQWIRGVMSLASRFLPDTEARVFAPSERDAALKWAKDLPVS